ncbi:helix-turn-helix domain-containing protein [Granulicella tundricola]|uniref:Helix-turn-helix domain protein n=1 Tax=Granulicella tundricola (strain ATCC BAA-1859 / DSM 23138 / MP5ACTX9) TaxID=1198114 RepID=E8X1L1_GRATM|nr:helix-turn-helix transcriptional regulator [Granulicella tundricola]ADW70246.1 helix-turn-helix domain protein [Granulicella tundricola MP5ACTX9]
MQTLKWNDLKHKVSAKERERIKQEAVAELDAMGFAALRKARQQTQVELAEKLGIDQASVSALENRSDLLLSTLAKYVRALGGNLEIRAVFPEAAFNLEPLLALEPATQTKALQTKRARRGASAA